MDHYPTLQELLKHSDQSRQLFDKFSPDAQVALQEQRQSIHTYDDLQKIAASFEERRRGW